MRYIYGFASLVVPSTSGAYAWKKPWLCNRRLSVFRIWTRACTNKSWTYASVLAWIRSADAMINQIFRCCIHNLIIGFRPRRPQAMQTDNMQPSPKHTDDFHTFPLKSVWQRHVFHTVLFHKSDVFHTRPIVHLKAKVVLKIQNIKTSGTKTYKPPARRHWKHKSLRWLQHVVGYSLWGHDQNRGQSLDQNFLD